jgi:hypothetical protein
MLRAFASEGRLSGYAPLAEVFTNGLFRIQRIDDKTLELTVRQLKSFAAKKKLRTLAA